MITFLYFKRIFNIFRDILFSIFYLETIDEKNNKPIYLSMIFLFLTIFMMNAEDGGFFNSSIIRLIFRTFCSFGYIITRKSISKNKALYYAILNALIITISHNIFLSPLTRPILLGTYYFVGNVLLNNIINLAIVTILSLFIYYCIYKILPLRYISDMNKLKLVMIIIITICSMYLNNTLRTLTDTMNIDLVEFSVFSILLQLTMLVCLVLIELYSHILIENYETNIQMNLAENMLNSIEKDKQNEIKVRALRHDLKNHMISLRYYLENQENKQGIEYIDSLLKQYTSTTVYLETGNRILDGILTQKVTIATNENIDTNVSVDFRNLKFINDVDLCIIFGNLLDNAIEACVKVDHPYLTIKSKEVNDQIIITIKNSHNGVIHQHLQTTKSDFKNHGIGLRQVNLTLEKYNGTLVTNYDNKQFTTVIQIPIKGQ